MIIYINKNTGEFTFHKLIAESWEMFGEQITIRVLPDNNTNNNK